MAKKQRPHELNDPAITETRRITAIHAIKNEYVEPTVKKSKKAKHPDNDKREAMREDKENNQHTFKHHPEYRKTLPKNIIK